MQTTVINHATKTIATYDLTPAIVADLKDLFSNNLKSDKSRRNYAYIQIK